MTAGGPRTEPPTGADRPEPVSAEPGPDALLETGEAVETACRTIIELLPPKQRAVLILCEVLRCSVGRGGQLLGTTVARGEQRAAAGPGHPARRATGFGARPDSRRPTERALLERYVCALRRHDVAAVIALATADAAQAATLPMVS